jgi:TolB-like protein
MADQEGFDSCDGALAADTGTARMTLFGEFHLMAPDGTGIALANRRARALLAMLSLVPDRSLARETVTRLLWPGRFETQARASLRQCLLELGKTLIGHGCAFLSVSRDRVGLVAGGVTSDLGELEQALAVGDLDQVTAQLHAIGTQVLLDEMQFGPAFDAWLHAQRSVAEHRIGIAIGETVARLERAGNPAAARRLTDAWALRDRRAAGGPARNDLARVAVLPFQMYGKADSADYFVDGIADELISTLGQVPQLMVTGRTSSFHFRGSELSLPAIATALGVSHVIEGSVQRQGEAVRVHVHLVDGGTGFELWGDRYDGTLDAIFSLQERIAQAVTAAIGRALGTTMQPPLVAGLTHSKEAYDLYLQGRALHARVFGDGVLSRAAELLEQAVALDADFAEAWVLLADVHQRMGIYLAGTNQAEASAHMAACVRKAMAIKPHLGMAYGLLSLHELTQNNFVGALDLAYRGYEVEPNNSAVAVRLGGVLLFCGLTREGMRYLNEAIDRDPVDGRHYMVRSAGQLNLGNVDAAIADAQRGVDLGFPSVWLGVAHAAAGNHDVAVEAYQQTRFMLKNSIPPPTGIAPMSPEVLEAYWLVAAKGVCSGVAEDRETYCRTLDYLYATMVEKQHLAITLPAVCMGYADLLFKTIGERITLSNMACLISVWADIDPIRQIWQHEEFIPFAQRIGLAAAWDKYGWPDLLPVPSNRV